MFLIYFHLWCTVTVIFRVTVGIWYYTGLYKVPAETSFSYAIAARISTRHLYFKWCWLLYFTVDQTISSYQVLLPYLIRLSFPVTLSSLPRLIALNHLGSTLLTVRDRLSRLIQLVDGRWTLNYHYSILYCHTQSYSYRLIYFFDFFFDFFGLGSSDTPDNLSSIPRKSL